MKNTIDKTKFQIESQISHLKNIPSGSIVVDKKSLLQSVNVIVDEIEFHNEKNKSYTKTMKYDRDEDKIKYLNKELELLLKENTNLKHKYNETLTQNKTNKFILENEM